MGGLVSANTQPEQRIRCYPERSYSLDWGLSAIRGARSVQKLATNLVLLSQLFGQFSQQ